MEDMQVTSSIFLPFATSNEDAPAYWMADSLWLIKSSAEQTGGKFSLLEQIMPEGAGPGPHIHEDMEELFYVIEGELTLTIADKVYVLTAGCFGAVPKKTVHHFKITSKENCRALNMYLPGGFEKGIMEHAMKATTRTVPPKGLTPMPDGKNVPTGMTVV